MKTYLKQNVVSLFKEARFVFFDERGSEKVETPKKGPKEGEKKMDDITFILKEGGEYEQDAMSLLTGLIKKKIKSEGMKDMEGMVKLLGAKEKEVSDLMSKVSFEKSFQNWEAKQPKAQPGGKPEIVKMVYLYPLGRFMKLPKSEQASFMAGYKKDCESVRIALKMISQRTGIKLESAKRKEDEEFVKKAMEKIIEARDKAFFLGE